MIKNNNPLSMAETLEYLEGKKDSEVEVKTFIKKFVKMKPEKAKELRKKLEELDMLKLKPENIVKIIDVLPEDKESLNKIFSDVSLDEDETKKILETLNEYQ
jgi:DNA-directed RNA polymerase subunit F